MRRRKLARILLRADLAIEDGALHDARAAIEEAREIDAACPGLKELETRLTEFGRMPEPTELTAPPHIETAVPNIASVPSSAVLVDPSRAPHRVRGAAIAAALVLAGGTLAYGARNWWGWSAQEPIATTASLAPAPVPIATSTVTQHARPTRLTVLREMITAREAAPAIVEDELPKLPAFPSAPIAAPDPAPEPDPVMMAVNRPAPSPPPPTPLGSRTELPAESVPPPSLPSPPVRASLPDTSPSPVSRAADATGTEPTGPAREAPSEPAAPTRDELAIVRSVLQRYESAYSNLDAGAASAVWPGVDRGALARAFDGLSSQRVSLGSCDVAVNGPAAKATCTGSATWQPKVGGGQHTQTRRWIFELRKTPGGWRIEKATAR